MSNNSLIDNRKKLSMIKKRKVLQARKEKLARLLKSNVPYKLRNIQGFTFNR